MSYATLTDQENLILSLVCGLYLTMFCIYLFVFTIYIKHVSKLTLHVNLKVILYHIPVPCLINMCAQFIQRIQFFANIEKIKNPWHPLIFISDSGAFANFYQLDVIVIERLFATIWVSTYENADKKFPIFSTCLITGQWILSMLTFTGAHIDYITHIAYIYHYVGCFIGFGNGLIAIFVFIFMPKINRKIHDEFLPPSYEALKTRAWGGSTLSQRYQSCENLRVAFLINVIVGVELLSVIVQIGIHATVRSLTQYSFNWYLALHLGYFSLNFHSLALMLIIIQPYFSTIDSCRVVKKTVVPIQSPEIVNKMYFDVYNKAWA